MSVVTTAQNIVFLLQQKLSYRTDEEFGSVLDDVLERLDKNAVTLTKQEVYAATRRFDNYLYRIGSSLEYHSHAQRFVDAKKQYFSTVEFDSVGIPVNRHTKGYSAPYETARLASTSWASARNQVGALQEVGVASATQEVFGSSDELFAFFALQVDARVLSEEAVRRSYVLSRREREARTGVSRIKSFFDAQEFFQLERKYSTLAKERFASEQELYNIVSASRSLF